MVKTTVILADGKFPEHSVPLRILKKHPVVFCDGAARHIRYLKTEPLAIVGDCDSVPPGIIKKYHNKIFRIPEQETNDLTKAVMWCNERGLNNILILGATGEREDHTIGNISLLAEYARLVNVRMITDSGVILPVLKTSEFVTFPGQDISFFSINGNTEITTEGLKYPLDKRRLTSWWQATLNRATGSTIKLTFNRGPVILFMGYGTGKLNNIVLKNV